MPIYRYSVLEAPPETHDIQYSLLFQLIAIRTRVKRMDGSDMKKGTGAEHEPSTVKWITLSLGPLSVYLPERITWR